MVTKCGTRWNGEKENDAEKEDTPEDLVEKKPPDIGHYALTVLSWL